MGNVISSHAINITLDLDKSHLCGLFNPGDQGEVGEEGDQGKLGKNGPPGFPGIKHPCVY